MAGYVTPVPATITRRDPSGEGKTEVLHDGNRKRMVAIDKGSRTQRRKKNRFKDGDSTKYGGQEKHKMRQDGRQAGGHHRSKMNRSKRQVLRTCNAPFNKTEGYVLSQGRPGDPVK